MEARCYATYDEFAWFYSRGWGADFHKQAQPVLEKHVLPRLPERARILDLCCGSGDLSRFLVTRGCRVTGMDGSEEMLRYAREHAPEAEFMLGDARHFALEPMFDGVLSTFDSLNHVLSIEELGCVFGNVCGALVQGGLFAFDMNMEAAFESLWRGFFHSIEENAVGITRGSYDRTEKLGKAEITTFRREGDIWRRQDVAVLERCYSEEEIATALERAGFRDVETHDAWELGMRGDIALGRVWFFARKPGRPE